jgi:hypothetical protein
LAVAVYIVENCILLVVNVGTIAFMTNVLLPVKVLNTLLLPYRVDAVVSVDIAMEVPVALETT